MVRSRIPQLQVLAVVAIAVIGLVVVARAYDTDDVELWLPDLATGWWCLAVGLVAWIRSPGSRIGPLLVAVGATWFLADVRATEWLWAFHRGPLFHALLLYPMGRTRSTTDRALIAAGYLVAAVGPLWLEEPIGAAIAIGALVVLVARWRTSPRIVRISSRPPVVVTAVIVAVLVGGAIVRSAMADRSAVQPTALVYELAIAWAALVLTAGVARRPAATLTDLVVDLGTSPSPSLTDVLAETLGDPGLQLGIWSPGSRRYLDANGREVVPDESSPGTRVVRLDIAGEPIALLIHDAALVPAAAVDDAVAEAARLVAANAELQAGVRRRIAEVEASRRRLVEVGDEERRRLAERLQEQVIARLDELPAVLVPSVSDEVRAEDQLDPVLGQQRRTVEALQTFARGLHPRELTTAGLAGALSSLAKASGIPTVVNVAAGRLPPEIEAPIYFCSVEAVANANKHSGARSIEIRIAGAGNRVTAEVVDDGVGGADAVRGSGLRGLADRIAALDGTFIVTDRPGGGTIVSIGLPLTRRSTGPDTGEPVSRS